MRMHMPSVGVPKARIGPKQPILAGVDKRIRKTLLALEDSLTPLQLAAIAGNLACLPPDERSAFQQLHICQLLAREQPTKYLRMDIARDIALYTDPNFGPADKSIILAFGGIGTRLSMAISVFLQFLPSAKFDVVILRDATRTQYMNGLGDYADDFPRLVSRLDKDLRPQRYRRVFCYGASMGGFPALRCGLLLGGVRSISVSGRFPWFIGRFLDSAEAAMPAFDMLCACVTSRATDFVCVYGEQASTDSAAVDRLERMFPVLRRPIAGFAEHNVIYEMWKRGTLRAFYREIFSSDPLVAGHVS
jgi:hypothetical protein